MNIITLTNEKGGVGKTTLSLHIAAGLALRGQRVLLVDSDAQGHCAQQLGVTEFGGLYRLLVQDAEWRDVLRAPATAAWAGMAATVGTLMLLPSNIETRAIPMLISDPNLLRERLAELKAHVDTVVIDTSPTPSLLHVLIYMASDYLVYPTKPEMLSLDGLAKSVQHVKQQNQARAGLGLGGIKLLGVAPVMVRQTSAHLHGLDLVEKHFGGKAVLPALPMRTVWTDREYARKTLYAYAPGDAATAEMDAVVAKIIKRMSTYAA